MKSLVFACISALSITAFAEKKMDMTCVTEFPTTSFVIREESDKVSLQVIHHNGTKYMPISDSLITPNDIDKLAADAKVLADLPLTQRFEWSRKQCTIQEEMIQSCHGPTDMQNLNGHKVKAWSFNTTWSTDKTSFGQFNTRKVSLYFEVDNQDYTVPMKYSETECEAHGSIERKLGNKKGN